MDVVKPFLTAVLIATPSVPALADQVTVEVEKLAPLDEIFGNVVGNYDRQDGLYSVKIPEYGPNGETLDCTVIKDTTVVYNLQGTPQALSQGLSHHCFLSPSAQKPR